MTAPLRFRPHHFFCALGFEGKGYSDGFTANMAAIVEGRLRAPDGEEVVIEVVAGFDAICAPCPRRGKTACEVQSRIDHLDAAHAQALDLAPGDHLTWGDALSRMASLPQGVHQSICAGCGWLDHGMCEAAHRRLRETG